MLGLGRKKTRKEEDKKAQAQTGNVELGVVIYQEVVAPMASAPSSTETLPKPSASCQGNPKRRCFKSPYRGSFLGRFLPFQMLVLFLWVGPLLAHGQSTLGTPEVLLKDKVTVPSQPMSNRQTLGVDVAGPAAGANVPDKDKKQLEVTNGTHGSNQKQSIGSGPVAVLRSTDAESATTRVQGPSGHIETKQVATVENSTIQNANSTNARAAAAATTAATMKSSATAKTAATAAGTVHHGVERMVNKEGMAGQISDTAGGNFTRALFTLKTSDPGPFTLLSRNKTLDPSTVAGAINVTVVQTVDPKQQDPQVSPQQDKPSSTNDTKGPSSGSAGVRYPQMSFSSKTEKIMKAFQFPWWCNGTKYCRNNKDNSITLTTDRNLGVAAFDSRVNFYYGVFSVEMKLPKANSKGMYHTWYVIQPQNFPNNDPRHAEIDIEFYGSDKPQSMWIATNIIAGGYQMLEQHRLPFDPTSKFHRYTISWGPERIIWFVDNYPIRMTKRKAGSPWPARPVQLLGTTWNQSGTTWSQGPIHVQYRNVEYHSCTMFTYKSPRPSCYKKVTSSLYPWNKPLSDWQKTMMSRYRKKMLVNSWNWSKWS